MNCQREGKWMNKSDDKNDVKDNGGSSEKIFDMITL